MPDDGRVTGERMAPHPSGASAAPPSAFGAGLTRGEDVVDLATWAGSVPAATGVAPRTRLGSKWFNLLWLLPIGFVGEGPMQHPVGTAVHRRVSRHRPARRPRRLLGPAGMGAMAALLQPILHAVHPALGSADPVRSPAAVLDPALHPRPGLVPDPKAGTRQPAVDRQAGLHQPARPGSACPASGIRSGWPAGGTSG